jgi:hypothetical protein
MEHLSLLFNIRNIGQEVKELLCQALSWKISSGVLETIDIAVCGSLFNIRNIYHICSAEHCLGKFLKTGKKESLMSPSASPARLQSPLRLRGC